MREPVVAGDAGLVEPGQHEEVGHQFGDRHQAIEEEGVHVLETMHPLQARVLAETQWSARRDVLVHIVHVGVRVVDEVVLDPPIEHIAPEEIDAAAQELVDPNVSAGRAVHGVVHHAHADARHSDAHHHHHRHRPPA